VERGPRLGGGASCRVYAWGPDRVVKVYRPEFEELGPIEAERTVAIHAAGLPVPACHGLVRTEGDLGLVLDRVDGPSMLDGVDADRTPVGIGRALASLHVELHVHTVSGLPSLADTLQDRGVVAPAVGDAPFHGDLHPANVLLSRDGPRVIDWSNAHAAPPAADVACSALAIGYRGLRVGTPGLERAHHLRQAVLAAYLEAYEALRPEVTAALAEWLSTIGALLLAQEPDTAFADELRERWISPPCA
jgi:thiamine kinase